ncbi:MAG: MaoC/PaaZ C-terminal domain-containing protein [Novosphingobium sp.]|nr:MaoC family dehydratase N-terminal domain-containing protein [Novosphingobium sp.]
MGKFDHLAGKELETGTYSWDSDRALLYAVGVGAGLTNPLEELQFTTENTQGVEQQVIPSFMSHMAVGGGWIRELGFPAREWDGYPIGLLHGEQGVSLARPIPPSGTVNLSQVLVGVFDKGSGALCLSETRATLADTGEYLGASRTGLFVRGQGGFGGPRGPEDEQPWVQPERAPDKTVSLPIPPGQSLIFRLLGDRNPHGTDPAIAKADGFDRPIFFGLGTYGFACRALLKGLCDGDVSRFGGMYGRFSKPVCPGETLDTHIWLTDGGANFVTTVDGDRVVIDRGTFRFAG